jgi:hypothetical protein
MGDTPKKPKTADKKAKGAVKEVAAAVEPIKKDSGKKKK